MRRLFFLMIFMLLSQELGTLLTGRHLDATIFPLSFREFLAFNHIHPADKLDIVKGTKIMNLFRSRGMFKISGPKSENFTVLPKRCTN